MTPFHFTDGEPSAPGTRRIDVPAHLATKAELLDFLAKAFPLPAYFGHNWDALEECLLDLTWLPHPKIALIHHDIPLAPTPPDQQLYLRILAAAVKASSQLHVTFPANTHATIESLLTK
jgi:hypothetical protein